MSNKIDPTIEALSYAAKQFEISVEAGQLQHELGMLQEEIDEIAICRCATWIGLKAKHITCAWERFSRLPLPILYFDSSEGWCVAIQNVASTVKCFIPSKGILEISEEDLKNRWTQKIILLSKAPAKASGFNAARYFWPLIAKHSSQLRQVLYVSLLLQIIAFCTPLLFQHLIDKVLVSRARDTLFTIGLAMMGISLAEPLFTFLRNYLFSHSSSKMGSELNSKLYRHLLSLPYNYFGQRSAGHLVSKVGEMEKIRRFLAAGSLTLLLDLVFVVMFVATLYYYSPILASIVCISLVCYSLFWLVMGKVLRFYAEEHYKSSESNTGFLTEVISGIETIKSTATENRFKREWREKLAHLVQRSFKLRNSSNSADQGVQLIHKICSAILIYIGVKLTIKQELTAGELVAFNMFAGYVTQPILRIAHIWQEFQHLQISLDNIKDILSTNTEASENAGSILTLSQENSIEFRQVSFRYDSDLPYVLERFDLKIKPGEFIGITGPSGCGKSTLSKLLQRLYKPHSGKIFINNQDISIIDPATLRWQIGVVLQDSILFSGTIKENILHGYPQATMEQVEHAATLAGAHDFICNLSQGYNTQVGEKGSNLSGGQRQRVALARALIRNPKILILDEATSALDYESQNIILSKLGEIITGRTVICIAHRLETLRYCDRILVMEDGKLIEQGNHNVLVAKGGYYANLWNLQRQ